MPKIRTVTDGIKEVRRIQRRKDMEKAKQVVAIVGCVFVFPIACSVLVRKFEKKFD